MNFENYDVIIFDLDGTLINSEPLHEQALKSVLQKSGIPCEHKNLHETYFGQSDTMVFKSLLSTNDPDKLSHLIDFKNAELKNIIENFDESEFMSFLTPGVEKFLSFLDKKEKTLALVSASEKIIVEATLKKARLNHHFTLTLGREDTFCGKPGPAPYLLAMRILGVDQQKVLIFEDSPTGLTAAQLSGAQLIIRIATFAPNIQPSIFNEFPGIANYNGLIQENSPL